MFISDMFKLDVDIINKTFNIDKPILKKIKDINHKQEEKARRKRDFMKNHPSY